WYKIKYGSGYGYISSSYTTFSAPSSSSSSTTTTTTTSTSTKTVYTTCSLNVRSGAGTSYSVIGVLASGKSATVVGTSGSWYKIKYGSGYGYIGSSYTTSSAPSSSSSTSTSSTSSSSSIVSYAKSLLGRPYVYGAAGPSCFDCSGFTQYVYSHFGKSIPRSSAAQYSSCTKISKSSLQPGDLVFFSNSSSGGSVGHVAIYMGNGQIIHAANASRGVCTDSLNSTYYTQHYIGAGRY
ncbi:MAG: NlpC/P60 family protein, partial [Clostridia bacterium]|nr:NlpC/P60 family protein [Clostridia bacterium]